MSTTNQINLMGRVLGLKINPNSDPKKSAVTFAVAAKRSYKNAEGKYDDDVINCVMFGAGRYDYLSKYLAKNGRVSVIGELRQEKYEKDGVKHNVYRVYISDISIIDFADKGGNNQQTTTTTTNNVEQQVDLDLGSINLESGDLPF